MRIKLNRETLGYTVCIYGNSGGCISFWSESLEDAMKELLSFKTDKMGITLVQLPYKKRMSRHIITKPTGLRDSGIFSKQITKLTDGKGNKC